jgi:hypothetical protein
MNKSIWGLMFKNNGSGIRFKSIQFSQEYSNQENVSTTAQKNVFKKITKDQCGRIERSKIELK